MKTLKLFILSVLTASLSIASAQNGVLKTQNQTPVYKANAAGWLVDINKAYEISKKTGKPILANFTGSDWCGWCKKLKYEVFDKAAFKTWAKDKVVLLELDFPRRFKLPEDIKKQNYSLAQAFNVTGYPTIWVFKLGKDEKGSFTINALGKTGYVAGGPANFIKGVEDMFKNAEEKNN